MLPVCIWLAGWCEWWLGLPAVALLGAGLWPALAGSWRVSRPRPAVFACVLLALGWVMLTAAGGVFDGGNGDWLEHRTTLLDPGRQPWPVFLPDVLADYLSSESNPSARPLLRYYLGWYMVPGLAARLGGAAALNWTAPFWSAFVAVGLLPLAAVLMWKNGPRPFFFCVGPICARRGRWPLCSDPTWIPARWIFPLAGFGSGTTDSCWPCGYQWST